MLVVIMYTVLSSLHHSIWVIVTVFQKMLLVNSVVFMFNTTHRLYNIKQCILDCRM